MAHPLWRNFKRSLKQVEVTTSSTNNSVLRGFFEKQKLTGPNFIDWYRQLRIVLSIEDKLHYLEQPIPPVPEAPEGQQVAPEILEAHYAWIKGSKEIAGLMLMCMDLEIQRNLEPLHGHEMLKELKTLFAQQAEQELLQTTRDFHSCKQEEWQSVSLYILKMKGYIDNLERLGHPVTLGLGVSLILIGLRKEYDGFVQNYNMHSMGKTVNELHAMLKLHEQTLTLPKSNAPDLHPIRAGKVQKGNKHKKSHSQTAARGQNHGKGKNKQAYALKPKIPPSPKRENPAKDSICHECGEIGHWKRNCPQYLAELIKKKTNATSGAGGSGIFIIELNTILNRSLIYDTGCDTHIYNTTQGLRTSRKLKPGALSLYVGNGQREVVEAIDAFYLCLPSGLKIVLNNYHYAPSITKGVISVSRFNEDGFVNRFVDNTIQVSRNNVVYFSAVPRDGIFEIDLSNSLTNESSIYAVSNKRAKLDLDSALLAFEKCVSCKSGKMERKPYTHQVERAKDLLGLIHTDHKHEVFETFKVFQKEVENQLGKTIKSLRSDRGGEYMSQEFLDHLKDPGIISHRTPSYTLQQNGVSERRNRTLLDMVRFMMSQKTLPKSFWDYAFETAACILNMVPTKKVEKTPYEVWHGKAPKLSYIKVWGYTSLNHKEDDIEIYEPQSDIVPIRRSTRTRHAPDRMCLYIDAEEHENITSRFQQNPGDIHWNTVKNILKYLRNTKDMFLVYGGDKKRELRVSCYTDAGYLTDADDIKSQTGYVRVRKFIYGLSVVPTIEEPISMYCDNTGAITIANESGITKCARHFRTKVHYLREVIELGDIKRKKVHTDDNLVDPLLKH
nr:zinc finger, CCHC-type [Tanacetum cinerariifolium]